MGFAPGPGAPTMLVVPSGARFPTSPPAMSVQYMEPSGPKARSSGPLTPSSGPQLPTVSPLSGSIARICELTTLAM